MLNQSRWRQFTKPVIASFTIRCLEMAEIYLHARRLDSVFELLGTKENSITFSLGWALSRSPSLLQKLVNHALGTTTRVPPETTVSLQEHGDDGGKTDIEIVGGEFYIVIEAKRGWSLPITSQLERYVPRLRLVDPAKRVILTMSECSDDFASLFLPSAVSGVRVKHVPWRIVDRLCSETSGARAERRTVDDLRRYLGKIVTMQNQESNWVYIVALNYHEWIPGLNSIQLVENHGMYFHPFGTGSWPNEASNYLGFRYGGKLQSVHHVDSHEVITNLRPHFPTAMDERIKPRLLYHLGPAIRPSREVRTGRIFRAGRKRAMLDLLLTSETIADASAKSFARVNQSPEN